MDDSFSLHSPADLSKPRYLSETACTLDAFEAHLLVQFDWDPQKNEILKQTRNISFEAIVVHLGRGDVWRIANHPDQKSYPGQAIFFVIMDDYIYIVPHEIRGDTIWLVTVIPSRKATRDYLKEK